MTTEERVDIFMSEGLPPESVTMPTADVAEFLTALSAKHPEAKFFITMNVVPGQTTIERKSLE